MTEFNKVFLDTAPLIYFLDEDIRFGGKMRAILESILNSGKKLITSSVTCEEYLVYPYRTANEGVHFACKYSVRVPFLLQHPPIRPENLFPNTIYQFGPRQGNGISISLSVQENSIAKPFASR